jgi:hypothetical protein
MPLPLPLVALLLFAAMLLPLPAPAGLAIALWALGLGLPLPALLAIYVLQDLLAYTVIRRALRSRHTPFVSLGRLLPSRIRRPIATSLQPISAEGGLLTATLLSFYAGATLAAARRTAVLRSAMVVVGVDVAKYANGLAVALGAAHVLPDSPLALVIAPLAGLAAIGAVGLLRRPRRQPQPVPVRVRS